MRTLRILLFAGAIALSACESKPPEQGVGTSPSPATVWASLAQDPLPQDAVVEAVWTGSEMIVWGTAPSPREEVGAAYKPSFGTWRKIASSGLGQRRVGFRLVWTGREMIVWGGFRLFSEEWFADCAAYDPQADRWRKLPPAPIIGRDDFFAAWTGAEMVVWGGFTDKHPGQFPGDGAAYDPATNRWRTLTNFPLAPRWSAFTAWAGDRMVVWSGLAKPILRGDETGDPISDGAVYDPAADRWQLLEPSPLQARSGEDGAIVWTGRQVLLWGGFSADHGFADGASYTPSLAATPGA